MLLVNPELIGDIDKYASEKLGIPTVTLMERAGKAVADAVRAYTAKGSSVSVFTGKGNNGGDGYAAALDLMNDYDVTVYDVFSSGQRSEEGKYFLSEYITRGGAVFPLSLDDGQLRGIRASECLIDAVFGTGFSGGLPKIAVDLIELFASMDTAVKIAVDVPLGVNASLGNLLNSSSFYRSTATVVLGFMKRGLVSYPAREYVGKLIYDNIGLQNNSIIRDFNLKDRYIDYEFAASLLPERKVDSHKGSFGKLLVIAGSETYPGAAHLSLEAALRSGVGYVTYLGEKLMCDTLLLKFPEVIYKPFSLSGMTDAKLDAIVDIAKKHNAVLIGSGLGTKNLGELFSVIERLLSEQGCPVILDADAINALAYRRDDALRLLKSSLREVILTPHPLEMSRITGLSTDLIQKDRLEVAESFALSNHCVLVLKGAGTIVTNGGETYINSSGSTALAKAGSGDVLAGLLSGLIASNVSPLRASALAVYLHGLAADTLSEELSEFGVTPSDLPVQIAKETAKMAKHKMTAK